MCRKTATGWRSTYAFSAAMASFNRTEEPFKRKWAGLWDLSAAGSAVSGENSRDAAERETREELGLEIDLGNARPVLTIHWERALVTYTFTPWISIRKSSSSSRKRYAPYDGHRWRKFSPWLTAAPLSLMKKASSNCCSPFVCIGIYTVVRMFPT